MLKERFTALRPGLTLFLGLGCVVCGVGQNTHGTAGEAARAPGVLTTQYLKTGLFVFSGAGGNSVLRLSGNGLIVVDGNHAEIYDELRRRIHRISEQPVRVLVNTNYLEQHTGTNAKFLADLTRVVGQKNEPRLLELYNPPGGKIAPPSDTFDLEQKLNFGLVEVDLLHFGSARTSADTEVFFPDLKVVALGDLYMAEPEPDYAAGGSLIGWGAALGEVLKLDFELAVPGSGAVVTRAEVQALKAKIDSRVARARSLVKAGANKEKLMAALRTDDPEWKQEFSAEQMDGFYRELTGTK